MTPPVSVLIRCRDEAEWLGAVLDAVLDQTVPAEIVVVDSGSRDGSIEIARTRGVHVHEIAPHEFTYGYALNFGFRLCTAPIVCALSAHALPTDTQWIERLTAPFEDARVVATYGRQLPHADLDPFRRAEILDYWRDEPRQDIPGNVRFSNANAAVRRAAWEEMPWDEAAAYSEDRMWAEWMVGHGGVVLYIPAAAVYHSHSEGFRAVYKRRRAEATHATSAMKSRREAVRWYVSALKGDLRLIKANPREWRWTFWSPVFRASEILGDRAGARRRS